PVYANGVGSALRSVRDRLHGVYAVDAFTVAGLVIQGDAEAREMIFRAERDGGRAALEEARLAVSHFDGSPVYRVAFERQRTAETLADGVVRQERAPGRNGTEWLGRVLTTPWTGVPV